MKTMAMSSRHDVWSTLVDRMMDYISGMRKGALCTVGRDVAFRIDENEIALLDGPKMLTEGVDPAPH